MASPTTLTLPPELDQRLLERPHHHWRRWVVAVAIFLTVAGVAGFILNWYGLLPWHGPMSGSVNEMGGITEMFDVSSGHRVAYTLYISNPSRVGVVLDSVEPVSQTPGLRGEDAWFFVDSPRCPLGVPAQGDAVDTLETILRRNSAAPQYGQPRVR